jgi:hypothetical protein
MSTGHQTDRRRAAEAVGPVEHVRDRGRRASGRPWDLLSSVC